MSCTSQPSIATRALASSASAAAASPSTRARGRTEDADQRHVVEPGHLDVVDDAIALEVPAHAFAAVGGELEPQSIVERGGVDVGDARVPAC